MKKILFSTVVMISIMQPIAAHAQQRTVSGVVTQVMDADTLRLGDQKIRLWGADALELRQTCVNAQQQTWNCGSQAQARLADLVQSKTITCVVRGTSYDRLVAQCELNGVDLSHMMVREGWSFDCARYSRGTYAADQAHAQAAQVGAWSSQFTWPWLTRSRPTTC
jgi:endonuclease YncB( thermonuclease family)